jgi:hypothetical protein
MSFELFFNRNRTSTQSITLEEADGNGLTLGASDKLRFKLFRRDQATPILDLLSGTATSSGSVLTITQTASAAEATLKVAQGDLASIVPGVYSAELSVVDHADSDLIKDADEGIVTILASGGGSVGLT